MSGYPRPGREGVILLGYYSTVVQPGMMVSFRGILYDYSHLHVKPSRSSLPRRRLQTSKRRQSLGQSCETRDLALVHRLEPLVLEQFPPHKRNDRRQSPTRLVRPKNTVKEGDRFLSSKVGGLYGIGGEVESRHSEEFRHGEGMVDDVYAEVGILVQNV